MTRFQAPVAMTDLMGAPGADTLSGGSGSDIFVLSKLSDSTVANPDTITAFSDHYDKIELTLDDIPTFVSSFTQGSTGIEIRAVQGTGADLAHTFLEIDTNGDTTADYAIKIQNFTASNITPTESNPMFTGDLIYNITGDEGANLITGTDNADTLDGAGGGDTINGGAGDDILYADGKQFNHDAVSNLKLWLDARDLNADGSIVTDGARVSTWQDKSGRDNHATQTDLNKQATFNKAGFNSDYAAITFDGSDDFLNLPDGTIPYDNSNYTVFAVLNVPDIALSTEYYFLSSGENSNNQNNSFRIYEQDGMATDGTIANVWWFNEDNSTETFNEATDYLLSFDYDNTSGRESWINNTSVVTGTNTNRQSDITQNRVGVSVNASSHFFDGNIAEILVFDKVLSSDERQRVNDMLAAKYGLGSVTGSSLAADQLNRRCRCGHLCLEQCVLFFNRPRTNGQHYRFCNQHR